MDHFSFGEFGVCEVQDDPHLLYLIQSECSSLIPIVVHPTLPYPLPNPLSYTPAHPCGDRHLFIYCQAKQQPSPILSISNSLTHSLACKLCIIHDVVIELPAL